MTLLSQLTRAHPQSEDGEMRHRAAAEIERLTAENERLRLVIGDAVEIVEAIAMDKDDDEVLRDLLEDLRAALTQEPRT
jgi:hypothetical protein